MTHIKRLLILLIITLALPLLLNHKPLCIIHNRVFFPLIETITEQDLGGEHKLLMLYTTEENNTLLQNSYTVWPLYRYGITPTFDAPPLACASKYHLLGTNEAGIDIFAYLIYAFCYSNLFALILTYLSCGIGGMIGAFSLFGPRYNHCLQGALEVARSIPLTIIVALSHRHLTTFFLLFICTQWNGYARLIQQQTQELIHKPYLLDAQHYQVSYFKIFKHHLLPHYRRRFESLLPHTFIRYLATTQALAYFQLPLSSHPSLGELIRQTKQHPNAWLILIIIAACFYLSAQIIPTSQSAISSMRINK